jgi:hypothetical protein
MSGWFNTCSAGPRHSNKHSILSARRATVRSAVKTVDLRPGVQSAASLIAVSKVFASKAGIL